MADTVQASKFDWSSINPALDKDDTEEGASFYLYTFYFAEPSNIVGGMPKIVGSHQAVFSHKVTQSQVVDYFKGFYDVRTDDYYIVYAPPEVITHDRLSEIKKELEARGYMKLESNVVEAQDPNVLIANATSKDRLLAKLTRTQRRRGL